MPGDLRVGDLKTGSSGNMELLLLGGCSSLALLFFLLPTTTQQQRHKTIVIVSGCTHIKIIIIVSSIHILLILHQPPVLPPSSSSLVVVERSIFQNYKMMALLLVEILNGTRHNSSLPCSSRMPPLSPKSPHKKQNVAQMCIIEDDSRETASATAFCPRPDRVHHHHEDCGSDCNEEEPEDKSQQLRADEDGRGIQRK